MLHIPYQCSIPIFKTNAHIPNIPYQCSIPVFHSNIQNQFSYHQYSIPMFHTNVPYQYSILNCCSIILQMKSILLYMVKYQTHILRVWYTLTGILITISILILIIFIIFSESYHIERLEK